MHGVESPLLSLSFLFIPRRSFVGDSACSYSWYGQHHGVDKIQPCQTNEGADLVYTSSEDLGY